MGWGGGWGEGKFPFFGVREPYIFTSGRCFRRQATSEGAPVIVRGGAIHNSLARHIVSAYLLSKKFQNCQHDRARQPENLTSA